jgi:hypothetical protein
VRPADEGQITAKPDPLVFEVDLLDGAEMTPSLAMQGRQHRSLTLSINAGIAASGSAGVLLPISSASAPD